MTGVDDATAAQPQPPAPSSPQELMIDGDAEKEQEEKKTESPSEEATTTIEGAVATAASDPKDDAVVAKKGKEKKEDEDDDDGKDYSDWPYKSIKEPHDNDVLYGRGGTCLQQRQHQLRGTPMVAMFFLTVMADCLFCF
jgi:hypothetical protein